MGAAIASEAPLACTRATTAGRAPESGSSASHPRYVRARATRARQASSNGASGSTPVVSSCAPLPAKNRFAPVRRREASNGSTVDTASVFGLRGEAHAALFADQAIEVEGDACRVAGPDAAVGTGLETQRQRWGRRRWRWLRDDRTLGFELDDLLPGAHQRIGEDQQQIPRLPHLQRRADRFLLVRDDRDRSLGHTRGL